MPHSTSLPPNGIVLDTNVLSLLAAARKLELLQHLATAPLYVTPQIVEELNSGRSKGVESLNEVITLIHIGGIQVLQLTNSERALFPDLPTKLGQGEAEAIAICYHRNMIFITRDRKAANYCDREGISCIRFKDLLRELVTVGLLTEQEFRLILT